MKDANGHKRSRPNSDLEENDSKRGSDHKEKTDKPKRKKLRKRRSSSSPEEDIIDGFVIASYSSLRSLEVVSSNTPDCLPPLDNIKNDEPVNVTSRTEENEKESTVPQIESHKEILDVKTDRNVEVKPVSNGNASHTEIDLSRQSPGQMTDDSSESGNSGKGYICDGESEDEQVPEGAKTKPSLSSVADTTKEVVPVKVDLSKDDDQEAVKNEKSFVDFDVQKSISSPKSSSFQTPSLSFSTPSSLTIPQSSHSISQSSWLPRLSSSSFKKPLATIEPCGSGSYSGTDALHQELNNRFLQSHSELERNSQNSKLNHEMHQHSHLHHHQHQHQHTHYYPSPLLPSPFFPNPSPAPSLLSQFSTPGPAYGSHIMSPYNKKTGKWCAAHVQIAWKIYCHQKVQGEISKDLHSKPEGISSNQSNTPIIPPFPSRHGTPGDLGFHSSHLHSRRLSGSPFGKPPVLIPRSSASTATMTSSSISAFSSVSSPPLAVRRTTSPVPVSRSTSETHGKRSPSSGPSTLYPWLKSEPKTPELDSEKNRDNSKREFHDKSPARISNFSVQALAGERAEIRPTPLRDATRTHSSREHRPLETRSFLENPLVPSLGSLDKRPIDYRPSTGSIDLNRNSLYPRYEPMHAMYSHHVTPLTPHITGYPYPSSSFLTDYHPPPAHPMILGARDPMASLVRTSDAPFYIRHDFDDRLGGRH